MNSRLPASKPIIAYGITVLLLTLCFTVIVSACFDHPAIGIDDANIFFIYARHIVQGHGFVFNIGDEAVEGFSSLLWVLMAAGAFLWDGHAERLLLGINALLMGAGLIAAALSLYHVVSRRVSGQWFLFGLFYLLLVFSSPGYVAWNTITLMDTGLFSALLCLTTLALIAPETPRTRLFFNGCIVLVLLGRPEGMIWGAAFILAYGFIRVYPVTKSSRTHSGHPSFAARSWRILRIPFLVYAVTLAGLTLFRLGVFGYPLPNTFYAKVSPSIQYNLEQGTNYFIRYLSSDVTVLIALMSIVVAVVVFLMPRSRAYLATHYPPGRWIAIPILSIIGLTIPILEGGDHFGSFRLYQAIRPIIIMNIPLILHPVLCKTAARLKMPLKGLTAAVLTVFVPAAFFLQSSHWFNCADASNIRHEFTIAENGRFLGSFMEHLFKDTGSYPSVGVIVAGGTKFTYPGRIDDLMGLNSTVMAHSPGLRKGMKNHAAFSKTVFYRIAPDVVSPVYWDTLTNDLEALFRNQSAEVLQGLFEEEAFNSRYTFAAVQTRAGGDSRYLVGYLSKPYAAALMDTSNLLVQIFENGRWAPMVSPVPAVDNINSSPHSRP